MTSFVDWITAQNNVFCVLNVIAVIVGVTGNVLAKVGVHVTERVRTWRAHPSETKAASSCERDAIAGAETRLSAGPVDIVSRKKLKEF